MKRYAAALIVLMLVLTGCGDILGPRPEKKTDVDPNAPPEPTAQDIANKIINDAQLDTPIPLPGGSFSPALKTNMLNMLRTAKAQYSADSKGQEALRFVEQRIDRRIKEFKNAEAWEHVMAFTDAFLVFKPESKKYNRLREQALVQLRKPRLTLRGLPILQGQKVALVRFYIPLDNSTYNERMFIGEELHGIKLRSVFGDDLGINVEYLETGERYVVYMPGKK